MENMSKGERFVCCIVMAVYKLFLLIAFASNLITWPVQLIVSIIEYAERKKGTDKSIARADTINRIISEGNNNWLKTKIAWRVLWCIWTPEGIFNALEEISEL